MTTANDIAASDVTAVILAGGRAQRFGGIDKALLPLAGRPLLQHILTTLRPQVGAVLLNSNRAAADYDLFALPVIADTVAQQPGPLAGLISGLQSAATEWVLTVPCDTPCLPADLVARMIAALRQQDAEVCTVSDGDRLHAAFMLANRRLLPALQEYLAGGGRRVQEWLRSRHLALADYADRPQAFCNINTPEELQAMEQRLKDHGC